MNGKGRTSRVGKLIGCLAFSVAVFALACSDDPCECDGLSCEDRDVGNIPEDLPTDADDAEAEAGIQ